MEQIEIKEFLRKAVEDIEAGIEIDKRIIKDAIKIEITVSKVKKAGGDVKIFIASGEGGVEKTSIAKASFEVYPRHVERDYPEHADNEYSGY